MVEEWRIRYAHKWVGKWNNESRSGMHEDKHGGKSQQVIPSIQLLHTYVRTLIHVYVRTYKHYHHYKHSLAEVILQLSAAGSHPVVLSMSMKWLCVMMVRMHV